MRRMIRPIEVVTCCICGKEFDKIRTREIFTGRVKYICPACEAAGNKELSSFIRQKSSYSKDEKGKDDQQGGIGHGNQRKNQRSNY